ncbi:MAG TPA: trypsin-like peptidase domain-containing protein [Jatrophihabitantaceae bacterium]|nr:trypsin-like peptidase domain-containing protein [Jatrophihabitantaceae bacterium]
MYPPDPQPVYPPALPSEAPAPPAPDNSAALRRRRIRIASAGVAALAAACVAIATGYSVGRAQTVSGLGTAVAAPSVEQQLPNWPGFGTNGGSGSSGNGGGNGSASSGNSTSARKATSAQTVGVVDIVSVLGYQNAASAGTGMVVTSDGEILTNNHVIDGATKITVTIASTGAQYTATVVGTDPTDDVAVLQLSGASGLATANFGDSDTVDVGETVTGVGNAGGVGGTPSSATGKVVALNQTLTASDGTGADAETLTGMIQSNAPIAAGDSGGPLYDTDGKVVGMDTAAETQRGVTTAAYSIPIDKALSLAAQIESGKASGTIHIGSTGFMGVSVADAQQGGAAVEQVVANGPAADAGINAGDVITAVNGTRVSSSAGLKSALAKTKPGDRVTITWTDSSGSSHRATVTLVQGPAD